MRKTKVRIVGDPKLADQIMEVIVDHFELAEDTQRFDHAVGRDYSHTNAEGATLYLVIKKAKDVEREYEEHKDLERVHEALHKLYGENQGEAVYDHLILEMREAKNSE